MNQNTPNGHNRQPSRGPRRPVGPGNPYARPQGRAAYGGSSPGNNNRGIPRRSRPAYARQGQGRPRTQAPNRPNNNYRSPRPGQANPRRQAGAHPYQSAAYINNKGRARGQQAKRKQGVPKWILISLDILIVVIIGFALFFFFKPKIEEKNRDQFKQEILDRYEKNPHQAVQVKVPKDFGKVTGEPEQAFGLEFMDNTADTGSDEVSLTYVGRLVIPKIQLVTPFAAMSNGVDYVSLRFGVGISPDFTPLGEPGLSVVFGHRFLTSGKDFNRLDEVVAGDQFYIDYAPTGKRYYYDVYDQVIIDQKDLPARVYEHFDEDVMVLVTCHPPVYDMSTERLLVYAKADPDATIDIPK